MSVKGDTRTGAGLVSLGPVYTAEGELVEVVAEFPAGRGGRVLLEVWNYDSEMGRSKKPAFVVELDSSGAGALARLIDAASFVCARGEFK